MSALEPSIAAGVARSPGSGSRAADRGAGVEAWDLRTALSSATVRRFGCAAALTFGLVLVVRLLALGESVAFGRAAVLDRPFGAAMQFTGLAHFIIGFAFMATSEGLRNARGRASITLALLVGAGLCGLFFLAGGPDRRPEVPMALLMGYFLAHELRDEFTFYRVNREGPARPDSGRVTATLLLSLIPFALAVVWAVQFVVPGARDLVFVDVQALTGAEALLLGGVPSLALLGLSGWSVRAVLARTGRSLRRILREDAPIWLVYLGIGLVVVLAAAMDGRGNSVVLLHVAAWWVFATVGLRRFGKSGGVTTLGLWTWLRRTQTGFQTLHIGLAVLLMAAAFVWVHGLAADTSHALAWAADPDAFYYWTIIHVTVSFVPRPT